MILLWFNVALFSAVVMAMLMFPLLRREEKPKADRADYDLTVYRDQLAEIDHDVTRGLLNEDQAEAARLEVHRRMLAVAGPNGLSSRGEADGAEGTESGAETAGRNRRDDPSNIRLLDLVPRAIEQGPWGIATLAAVVAIIPIGSLALYLIVGSPWLPGQPHAQRIAQVEQAQLESLPDNLRLEIETLLEVVNARPDEARAWYDLGRAYRRAEQHANAVAALEKARELGLDDVRPADFAAELAESLLLSENGQVTERARSLFLEALRADPNEPRARFYMGMAAAQEGEPLRALAIWRELESSSPDDAPWMPMVRQTMSMVAMRDEIDPRTVKPAHPLTLEAGAAVERQDPPPPSAEGDGDVAPDGSANAGSGMAGGGFSAEDREMIDGMVARLAARLEENPDDPEGWLELARSHAVLGAWGKARTAAERAIEAAPDSPDVLARAADILVAEAQAAGQTEPPARVYALYEIILKHDPENSKAQYFVGLSAAHNGDYGRARLLWRQVLESMPEDQPARAAIQRQLDALPEARLPADGGE